MTSYSFIHKEISILLHKTNPDKQRSTFSQKLKKLRYPNAWFTLVKKTQTQVKYVSALHKRTLACLGTSQKNTNSLAYLTNKYYCACVLHKNISALAYFTCVCVRFILKCESGIYTRVVFLYNIIRCIFYIVKLGYQKEDCNIGATSIYWPIRLNYKKSFLQLNPPT